MMKLFILVALLAVSGVRCEFDQYSDDVYSDGEPQSSKDSDFPGSPDGNVDYNDYDQQEQQKENPDSSEDADTSDKGHPPEPLHFHPFPLQLHEPDPHKHFSGGAPGKLERNEPTAQEKLEEHKVPEKKAPEAGKKPAKKPVQKPAKKAPTKKTPEAAKKPEKKPAKKTPAKKTPAAAKKPEKKPAKKPTTKAPAKKTPAAKKSEKKSTKKAPKAAKHSKHVVIVHASDMGSMGLQVLMALFTILASAIIGLNAIVLWSTYMNEEEDRFKFNIMKGTLAILDICNGIYIFAVIIPNLFWTIQNVSKSMSVYQLTAPTSSSTAALGTFFLLVFISYLYSLTYFGVLRYNSVKYPDQIVDTPRSHIRFTVVTLIVVSVVVSTIPAWFPSTFTFDYQHNIFTYWVESIGKSTLQNSIALVLLLLICIPYLSLFGTTIASWIVTKQNAVECLDDPLEYEREVAMTKTVSAMVICFVITTFPFVLVSFLLVADLISFETSHITHTATFFVFCCRSVINMGVYMTSAIPETGAMRENLSPGSSCSDIIADAQEVVTD